MNITQLANQINDLEEEIQKRIELYNMDTGYVSIVDDRLDGYLEMLHGYCRSNQLYSYAKKVEEYRPVATDAPRFFGYWDVIKDELQKYDLYFRGIKKLHLIEKIQSNLRKTKTAQQIIRELKIYGIAIPGWTDGEDDDKLLDALYAADGITVMQLAEDLHLFADGLLDVGSEIETENACMMRNIEKCRQKITLRDYDGAITNARTLMEETLRAFDERASGTKVKNKGDLNLLYKNARKHIQEGIPDDKVAECMQQLLGGLSGVATNLAGLSNELADRHANEGRPSRQYAELMVNIAFAFCRFFNELPLPVPGCSGMHTAQDSQQT